MFQFNSLVHYSHIQFRSILSNRLLYSLRLLWQLAVIARPTAGRSGARRRRRRKQAVVSGRGEIDIFYSLNRDCREGREERQIQWGRHNRSWISSFRSICYLRGAAFNGFSTEIAIFLPSGIKPRVERTQVLKNWTNSETKPPQPRSEWRWRSNRSVPPPPPPR